MNWRDRIELARRNGTFPEVDRSDAGNWLECACGQQDDLIPRVRPLERYGIHTTPNLMRERVPHGGYFRQRILLRCDGSLNAPKDPVLRWLGFLFSVYVNADDFDKAERCVDLIERRAQKVVARELIGEWQRAANSSVKQKVTA